VTTVDQDLPVTAPVPVPTPTSRDRRHWWIGQDRPAWALPAHVGVTILAAVLYTWGLSNSVGMGNSFYAAAVKSGTESWKAFLFGSLDPGNFITVDKPPASLWVMELSGRAFGFSSWSMLLPEALAGVATVAVLYHLVRRWFGDVAALLAGLAMALTPIAVVMFRDNNPDALLTLLLLLSAWTLWSSLESGRTWPLVICGALLGLAFTTKMLQAFIVVPVFGLVYLYAGPPRLGRRIVQLLAGGLALVVFSSWWVAVVELWPASSRPFIGSSTNNTELNLIFGYNGFGRLLGSTSGPTGGISSLGGGSLGTGGQAGWLRMFNDLVGGQISWLLPLALGGVGGGLGWG
jgi:4-amino-4-deoxy-L-arabinose transferase-like glycosyltransferase